MSSPDEKDQKLKEQGAKGQLKLEAVKALKELSNPDSQWTLTQEILQDICAGHVVADPDKTPPATQLLEELKKEIETRYANEEEKKKIILDSVPSVVSIRQWLKKEGWDEAVWKKVRGDSLFSPQKRAKVIEALRDRAIDKSDLAAKIWLTLSGDYSDKMEVDNKSIDVFREINTILHRKSRDE